MRFVIDNQVKVLASRSIKCIHICLMSLKDAIEDKIYLNVGKSNLET